MPLTPRGLPYPAATDPPNGPLQIQQLAEALDLYIPIHVPHGANQTVTNSTTLVDSTGLRYTFTQTGLYKVEAYLHVTGDAGTADVKVAWAAAAGLSISARGSLGPGVSSTTAADGGMRSSFQGSATAISYGVPSAAYIKEDLMVTVNSPGELKMQWAQQALSATGTVMQAASRMIITKLYAT